MKNDESLYVNSVFEQPWWLNAVAEGHWDEVILVEDDEIIGRLPFCFKGETTKTISMPPLTQTCGCWIKPFTNTTGNEHLSYQKKVLDGLMEQLPKYHSLKIHLDTNIQYFLPFIWKGYHVEPRISYRIMNLDDLDSVYQNFSKTVKKNIKSAIKKVEIQEKTSLEVLIDMLEKTFAAQGRKYPISKEIVEKIIVAAEEHNSGKMYIAIDAEGHIHACSYFVFDKNVFYYLISGADPNYRTSGAQTLILWRAIQDAAKHSRYFDFEGSMVEGIETFFRRFGGKPVVYYEISKQSVMNEMKDVLKPRVKRLLGYKI